MTFMTTARMITRLPATDHNISPLPVEQFLLSLTLYFEGIKHYVLILGKMSACFVLLLLALFFIVITITSTASITPLEQALLDDMFPPSSCVNHNQNTTFRFNFTPSSSKWSNENAQFEQDVFLVEMQHSNNGSNNSSNSNNNKQSWTIRIGRGGQIYSFTAGFGEAIPPQSSPGAAWMDTVLQMVAVDGALNDPPHDLYYIHQAGTYMHDSQLNNRPFYSPTLASHCEENHCSVISWGQQAHVPSRFRSDVLYYMRYSDCGDGVLELTMMVQNNGNDTLSYLNVPWVGLRQSTLHDVLLSNKNGSLHHEFPMQQFNDEGNEMPSLHDTGGFTVFAQSLPPPTNATTVLPCRENGKWIEDCQNNTRAEAIRLVVQRNDSARFVAGLSGRYGYDIVRMELFDYGPYEGTIEGCRRWCGPSNGLLFVNNRTGSTIQVDDVLHWVWRGRYAYFAPTNMSSAEINQHFIAGDEVQVRYGSGHLLPDENLALAFVHGRDREYSDPNNSWFRRPSRLRYGGVPEAQRDALIFTVNFLGTVGPGDTYTNRHFMVVDGLAGMEDRAKELVNSTQQSMLTPQDHQNGRKLTIHATNHSFAIELGDNTTTCQEGLVKCVGSTVTRENLSPLFYITCGNRSYVGFDQYVFAPPRESDNDPYRPYVCDDQKGARPTWTLLGYFESSDCNDMDLLYEPNLC